MGTSASSFPLRGDEAGALIGAGVLHAALIAVLLLQPEERTPPPEPERVVVNLAEEVGMTSTAPNPVPVSRAAQAPTLADRPAPPVPTALPELTRPTTPTVQTPSPPRAQPRPRPARTEAPRPRPTRASRPAPAPTRAAAPRPRPTQAPARTGGSRIGSDFLPGAGTSTTSTETRTPARTFGASERSALVSAINRQLKPHWQGKVPQGLDAEQLVTVLTWELNSDGSLRGRPRVVRQLGITDANRAQAGRHAEVAIRAVQLAAPFNLPDEFYDQWKRISDWRFDRRL
ncbi:energy transducer TonB [Qipengyuania sp. DSG2-2]|uniref:energy transducer TonB n=1 Tax=Qipengyuania sp. DGS2-2 TaxID=3349631 RepID=UPI0036D390B7